MAVWQDPALDAEQINWAREAAAAAEPWSFSGGGYVNYMQADEPIERVRATFGTETFNRLQKLKQKYDPHNILCRNQNIPRSNSELLLHTIEQIKWVHMKIHLIDGTYELFRNHFGAPPTKAADGREGGAPL